MSTWTSKARIGAALAALTLAGCGEIALPDLNAGSAEPLRQAPMARGDVVLSAPQGYCIDRRSLRARFALLARCDTLDVEGFFAAWELAIVTVSLAPANGSTAPDTSRVSGGAVLREETRGGLKLTQLQNPAPPLDGVSQTYWRTAFVLNGQLVSLALYAPTGSGAVGQEGARLLQAIATASQRATGLVNG